MKLGTLTLALLLLGAAALSVRLTFLAPSEGELTTRLVQSAQKSQSAHVVWYLVEGAKINAQNREGKTALMASSEAGDFMTLRYLLDKGAKVNLRDAQGNSALMLAAQNGHEPIVHYLQERGAYLDIQNSEGKTALMLAAARGQLACVQLLLEKGASLSLADAQGETATMAAVQWPAPAGMAAIKKALIYSLDDGVEEGVKNKLGQDFTMLALANGVDDELLFDIALDFNNQDNQGKNALMYAMDANRPQTAMRMLAEGGPPYSLFAKDSAGVSARDYARSKGYTELEQKMAELEADLERQFEPCHNQHNRTYLKAALAARRADVVSALLAKGASLDGYDDLLALLDTPSTDEPMRKLLQAEREKRLTAEAKSE